LKTASKTRARKPKGLSAAERKRLVRAARAACRRAYAPYSRFHVGAAVLTGKGTVYSGCNVENASYGLTNCAERTAIFTAVASEGSKVAIRAVAVHTNSDAPCAPCGACRQVIFEFGPDAVVLFSARGGLKELGIRDLLPYGFRLS
jgi:cytidine deaminase